MLIREKREKVVLDYLYFCGGEGLGEGRLPSFAGRKRLLPQHTRREGRSDLLRPANEAGKWPDQSGGQSRLCRTVSEFVEVGEASHRTTKPQSERDSYHIVIISNPSIRNDLASNSLFM